MGTAAWTRTDRDIEENGNVMRRALSNIWMSYSLIDSTSALCQKGLNPILGVIELLISPCRFHHSL